MTRGSDRLLLGVLGAAQFMLIVDTVVVIVALPTIQAEFGLDPAVAQWTVTAYVLAYGGFMITAGRIADLFGAKRTLLAGLALFTIASAACALAPGGAVLFAARALQGLGAALVSPAALTLVTTSFAEGDARNRALGFWGAIGSAGAVAANLLGGVLTDLGGWRWVFLVNVPVGLLVLAAVTRLVRSDTPRRHGRVDVIGACLLTGTTVLLTAGVTQAAHGWGGAVAVCLLVSGVLLAVFVRVETRAAEPMVRLSLLRDPNVGYGNLLVVLNAGAAMVASMFSMQYMQGVLGMGPMAAGLGSLPVTVAILIVASRTGALVARFGVLRLLAASAVLLAFGTGLLSTVAVGGGYWTHVLPGLLISGIGAGLSYAPAMIVATTGISHGDQGLASGLVNTSMQLGGALGLAVFTAVAASVAGSNPGLTELTGGYQAAFRWALLLPAAVLVAVAALGVSRRGHKTEARTSVEEAVQ
ncbi:MFS transporter [Microtetraspora fusca]|uniref:MFS transporter n=1 Tax=Microtetraspora fusca TaxID=1997 RepID=UPI00082D8091|nr:MFS transporter [Microtetraspora fusca]